VQLISQNSVETLSNLAKAYALKLPIDYEKLSDDEAKAVADIYTLVCGILRQVFVFTEKIMTIMVHFIHPGKVFLDLHLTLHHCRKMGLLMR
jgi:hypothetical protein